MGNSDSCSLSLSLCVTLDGVYYILSVSWRPVPNTHSLSRYPSGSYNNATNVLYYSLTHKTDNAINVLFQIHTHTHSLSDKNDNTIDVKSQIRVGKETAENVLSLSFIEIRENVVLRASFSKPLKAATTRRPLNQINIFKFTLKTLF